MINKMNVNNFLKQLLLLFNSVVNVGMFLGFVIQNDNYLGLHIFLVAPSLHTHELLMIN
jgi:hypothetical protein